MSFIAYILALFCFVFALFGVDVATRQQLLYLGLAFFVLGHILEGKHPWSKDTP